MGNKFFVEVKDSEISGFRPNGDTIRIQYDENLDGDRLEFGCMEKKLFHKSKFVMQDYVPISIVQSIMVSE